MSCKSRMDLKDTNTRFMSVLYRISNMESENSMPSPMSSDGTGSLRAHLFVFERTGDIEAIQPSLVRLHKEPKRAGDFVVARCKS